MTNDDAIRSAEDPERSNGPPGEADLDRLVARSLAASERGSRAAAAPPPSRTPWPWLLAAVLFALLLGMLANPWLERQVRGVLPPDLREPPAASVAKAIAPTPDLSSWNDRMAALEEALRTAQAQPLDAVAGAAEQTLQPEQLAGMEGRLAALESVAVRLQSADATTTERLDRLVADVAAISGGSNAQREQVSELLMVTAVRRLFERGRMLGPLMSAVEARFSTRDPDAVEALAAWNSMPVTRQSLATRLDDTANLQAPATDDGWWQSLKRRLAGIVQVREAGAAPEAATIASVREALIAEDLDKAIARMAAAPATVDGNAWLVDARRLQAAETALERMELSITDGMVQVSTPATASATTPAAEASASPSMADPAIATR